MSSTMEITQKLRSFLQLILRKGRALLWGAGGEPDAQMPGVSQTAAGPVSSPQLVETADAVPDAGEISSASPEAAVVVAPPSVGGMTAVRPEAIRAKIEYFLERIQYAAEEGKSTARLETDVRLLAVDIGMDYQAKIDNARQRGENALHERQRLGEQLPKGVCSPEVEQYWREMLKRAGWFKRKAGRQISWKLRKELQETRKQDGLPAAEKLLARARELYGEAVEGVAIPDDWRTAAGAVMPSVVRGTMHTLPSRQPVQAWHVYIDETGMRFSADESGTEGRVVAVCVPQGSTLPNLGAFHSADADEAQVLRHCNTLLESECGILGFTRAALDIRGHEGWLQAIRELVKWVWRLLPLPDNGQKVGLCFHVEQRSGYNADRETMLGEQMLSAELEREDPVRAGQIHITSFDFADKDAPMLAWADVVAHLWGRDGDIGKRFRQSGLVGTCLVESDARVIKICENIFTSGLPDGNAWIVLMQEKRPKGGSLHEWALERLQQRCHADPKQWGIYVQAMQEHLASKEYALEVLERMGEWLRPMRSPSATVEFYWRMADLARCNHAGDVGSDDMLETVARLNDLAPKMEALDPMAPLHTALRLAVANSNAFDFARAEAKLAPWNPRVGGRLTGSALWDGKILSSLGQYKAFQGQSADGVQLFRQALERFAELERVNAEEARRQMTQTLTYLAVAQMDVPGVETDLVRAGVEQALGMSVAEATERWGRQPAEGSPYPHYLLARYLACAGTAEERALYSHYNDRWTTPEQGFGRGHPWPQIQYFRWLMTDVADVDLRRELAYSLEQARGKDNMPTVELIVAAIAISMELLSPGDEAMRAWLLGLEAQLPYAEAIIQQLASTAPGDALLAKRVIPFNFC